MRITVFGFLSKCKTSSLKQIKHENDFFIAFLTKSIGIGVSYNEHKLHPE